MRLSQLHEDQTDTIRAKCSDAMNLILYRGSNDYAEEPGIYSIRQDRKPKDSNVFQAGVFNSYMEFLGFPHRKSNTLSVSTEAQQASEYGDHVYRIYPFDGSTYVFSLYHDDMLDVSKEMIKMIMETREVRMLLVIDSERTRTTWDMVRKFSKMVAAGQITKENFDLQDFFRKYAKQLDAELGMKQVGSVKQIPPNVGEVIVHGSQYVAEPIEVQTYENPPKGLSNYLE